MSALFIEGVKILYFVFFYAFKILKQKKNLLYTYTFESVYTYSVPMFLPDYNFNLFILTIYPRVMENKNNKIKCDAYR
jgi:hypothetical protein